MKAGLSSRRMGKVCGSRPAGLTAPNSTSAMALPHSWPGYQACSTPAALFSHGIVDRPAGLQHHDGARVRGRDAARPARSGVRPGRCAGGPGPRVSQSPFRPTNSKATSDAAASCTARYGRVAERSRGARRAGLAAQGARRSGRSTRPSVIGLASLKLRCADGLPAPVAKIAVARRPAGPSCPPRACRSRIARLQPGLTQAELIVAAVVGREASVETRREALHIHAGRNRAQPYHLAAESGSGWPTSPREVEAFDRYCTVKGSLTSGRSSVVAAADVACAKLDRLVRRCGRRSPSRG